MLKPCPLCGSTDVRLDFVNDTSGTCNACECHINDWNYRPIEDTLAARAEKAEAERDGLAAQLAAVKEALVDIDRWDTECCVRTDLDWQAVSASMGNRARAALAGVEVLAVVDGYAGDDCLWADPDGEYGLHIPNTPMDDEPCAPVRVIVTRRKEG